MILYSITFDFKLWSPVLCTYVRMSFQLKQYFSWFGETVSSRIFVDIVTLSFVVIQLICKPKPNWDVQTNAVHDNRHVTVDLSWDIFDITLWVSSYSTQHFKAGTTQTQLKQKVHRLWRLRWNVTCSWQEQNTRVQVSPITIYVFDYCF